MLQKGYKIRILIVFIVLFLLFMAVEARLYQLQISSYGYLTRKAQEIHVKRRVINPFRGEIVDRNGNVLAVSTRLKSLYVNPLAIPSEKKEELAKLLSPVLVIPPEKIQARLEGKSHVSLARKISQDKAIQVDEIRKNLKLISNSLYFVEESKRLYPLGRTLSPVLGYTTIDDSGDNRGIFGLELKYNDWLSGKYEKTVSHRTALHQYLEPIEQDLLESTYGSRLILTIDQTLQYIVEKALRSSLAETRADSAVGLLQDVKTGEILALCSLPSFDPDIFHTYDAELRRNRCISDPIEPGSVMKIFTAAILLDTGLVRMDEIIDCRMGHAVLDGRSVWDAGGHKMGRVPFPETFYFSSNVAFCSLGLRIDPIIYYSYLRAFGFGQKTGIDLPDESAGILYPVSKWTKYSRTSLAMGYEIGITPLQIIAAISALGNRGQRMQPYLVREIQDAGGHVIQSFKPREKFRMVSPQTADRILGLMEGVVVQGTGKKAMVSGYRIGGKTGTTRKSNKKDEREYIAGFAALFPIENPRIACYIAIDNPKGAYYASDVAVPVFREIARQTLSHFAIPPSIATEKMQVVEPVETVAPKSMVRKEAPQVLPGQMPDFSGLTMKEALKALRNYSFDVRFVGSGVVIDQSPKPAAALTDLNECVLVFGKPGAINLSGKEL
ncbi:PASTA domain-containing protein [Candidatus Sumerlaeota bacterium]|nr:PASTA domain-containing protein [Candidatus Sumerlaeota bacterium]